jgi:chorismate mutase
MSATRADIDALDDAIVDLLARRAEVVAALWAAKRAEGRPLHDAAREAEVLARVRVRAAARGIDPDAVEATFRTVLGRARERG